MNRASLSERLTMLNTERTHQLAGADTREFLGFRLGAEEYGIDIQDVRELRGYSPVTRIADAPEHLMGVVNLRGLIVPIIDMRIRFGLGNPNYDVFTVVIIVGIAGGLAGVVVDGVSGVFALGSGQVKPMPVLAALPDVNYLVGIGTDGDRMVTLIDIARFVHGLGIPDSLS